MWFDDLNHALDELGATTKKYYRLRHPGSTLGGLTPIVGRAFLNDVRKALVHRGTPLPSETDLG